MESKTLKLSFYAKDVVEEIRKTKGLHEAATTATKRIREILITRPYLTESVRKKKKIEHYIKEEHIAEVIDLYQKEVQENIKKHERRKNKILYEEYFNPYYSPIKLRRKKVPFSSCLLAKIKVKASKPLGKDEQRILFEEYDYHDHLEKKYQKELNNIMNNGRNPEIISYLEEKISENQQEKEKVEEEVFSSITPLIVKRLIGFNIKNPCCSSYLDDVFLEIYYLLEKKMKDFDQIRYPHVKFATWFDYQIRSFLQKWPWKNNLLSCPNPIKDNDDALIKQKNNTRNFLSLDYPLSNENTTNKVPAEDIIGNEYGLQDNVEEKIYRKLKDEKIRKIKNKILSPIEKRILELRYDENPKLTFEEIKKEFNVSRQRIQQIEANALKKLRRNPDLRKLYYR